MPLMLRFFLPGHKVKKSKATWNFFKKINQFSSHFQKKKRLVRTKTIRAESCLQAVKILNMILKSSPFKETKMVYGILRKIIGNISKIDDFPLKK